jgi:hypothetical protein
MLTPLRYAWQRVRRFAELVHGYDDVRETYGDNPNNLSEEHRLAMRGAASNIVGGSSNWGGF